MRTILTQYRRHATEIRAIRDEVFIQEQNVPLHLEADDRDMHCIHSLAYADDLPVATGRIDLEKDGKIGRVAVLKRFRRQGYGTAVMEALLEYARQASLRRVWFHAQRSALPFYAALGYETCGQPFDEAGIEHIAMQLKL